MDSIDLEVLKTCADWLAAGKQCELVTITKTWGSSPRPEGATLGICEDGHVWSDQYLAAASKMI
jgi:xanthine dehydrogenase accessory factor